MAKGSKIKQVADLLDVDNVDVWVVCLGPLGPVPGQRPDREQTFRPDTLLSYIFTS